MRELKAPFPWFGGKSRVAHLIWDRFGAVPNYVEPFAGSLAVLLARPGGAGRNETMNDKDSYLANFWLAVKHDPAAVAHWADDPVNETFLHSRHKWLVRQAAQMRKKMDDDPDYFDPRIAGWWVWGLSLWIGAGWCAKPEWKGRHAVERAPKGMHRTELKRPTLPKGGHGVHSKGAQGIGESHMPYLDRGGRGVHQRAHETDTVWNNRPELKGQIFAIPEQKPDISGSRGASGRGVHAKYAATDLEEYFGLLADRLRRVRVCCGDWKRILGPSPTTEIGVTGVFLDPPYGVSDRDAVYNEDSKEVASEVFAWAIEHGDDPKLRIAVCGYEGEHDFPASWECIKWKAGGGYGNQAKEDTRGRRNAERERIWFSPACLTLPLFQNWGEAWDDGNGAGPGADPVTDSVAELRD